MGKHAWGASLLSLMLACHLRRQHGTAEAQPLSAGWGDNLFGRLEQMRAPISDSKLVVNKPLLANYKRFVYDLLLWADKSLDDGQITLDQAMDINVNMISRLGVNGVMDIIEEEDPGCHGLAHQVGRAAVRITSNLGLLVSACGSRCHTGCFHGVTLGLVVDSESSGNSPGSKDHLRIVFQSLCNDTGVLETYGPGECLHAAGHAATLIMHGDAEAAATICMEAYAGDRVSQHYCGTGLYMQAHLSEPVKTCTGRALPGACFMYGWRRVRTAGSSVKGWAMHQLDSCQRQPSKAGRLGCVFGLAANVGERILLQHGKAVQPQLLKEATDVVESLCLDLKGEMLAACLDGFLLRSVKYYPRGAVEVICSPLREKWRGYALDKCLWTGRLTQYSLEREVSRYVDDHPSPPSEI